MKLINADLLEKQMNKEVLHLFNSMYTGYMKAMKCVKQQPIAFDVDKVVEQLEKLADEANDKILEAGGLQLYYDGYEDAMRTVVEIVKGGGVE